MLLEGEGAFLVDECDVVLYRPRRVFRRVRYFACVVLLQTSAQVAGDSDVVMFGVLYAAEDIHIGHETLAGILARRAVAREGNARLRLWASARQPSLKRQSEGWWAWVDLNHRPRPYQVPPPPTLDPGPYDHLPTHLTTAHPPEPTPPHH